MLLLGITCYTNVEKSTRSICVVPVLLMLKSQIGAFVTANIFFADSISIDLSKDLVIFGKVSLEFC